MRNSIIVAPYGYEELDEMCENTQKYPLIYLGNSLAREAFNKGKFKLFFCEKNDYEDDDKSHFFRDVAERALDSTMSFAVVYVVLPKEELELFLRQLASARNASLGDVLVPLSQTLIEKFEFHLPYDPDFIFSVRFSKTPEGYVPILGHYYKQDATQEKVLLSSVAVEEALAIERMYTVLTSGDYSGLYHLDSGKLERLEKFTAGKERYDLAAKIRDVRKQKE